VHTPHAGKAGDIVMGFLRVDQPVTAHRWPVSPAKKPRPCEDLPLLAQHPVLAAQPPQLLTLGRGQPIGAVAGVQVSLADLLADRGLGQV
jgi:hypothetical protein